MNMLQTYVIWLLLVCEIIAQNDFTLSMNVNEPRQYLRHFWRSTGLCPLAPRSNISQYLSSEDEKMNLALIGAMPNKSIKQIRIHWLLDLITIKSFDSNNIPQYNFGKLDSVIDWLNLQGLRPGFELMGNPSSYFNDFLDPKQKEYWQLLIRDIVLRYIDIYGIKYVNKWRFETWNEPDLKGYNILNFTLAGYSSYVDACANGLFEVKRHRAHKEGLKLGGPAGLFKSQDRHPLCWGLVSQCNQSLTCPLSFISFHKKGDGTASGVLNKGIELVEYIHSNFPKLSIIPIANTEADILTGWSKSKQWRGDVRYAAMAVKVIIDYYREFVQNRKIHIELLSNDNAFINYHPYYFTQRTLLARFQMNNTNPPHKQFFKKPIYVAMALLSYLGNIILPTPKLEKENSLAAFLSTTSNKTDEFSIIMVYVNDTFEDRKTTKILNISILDLPSNEFKYVVYVLDNIRTNPYYVWKDAGAPVFPDVHVRRKIRQVEGPLRLVGPAVAENNSILLQLKLTVPSVLLIHACSKSSHKPGHVDKLQIFNVTRNEMLITWSDNKVKTRCIRTYEIEFLPDVIGNEIIDQLFRRVNADDVIFLWYQYVATGEPLTEATRGLYRVRAVDYWDQPGPYSASIRFPS